MALRFFLLLAIGLLAGAAASTRADSTPTATVIAAAGGLACDESELASRLVKFCTKTPPVPAPDCCSAVLATVDNRDPQCLCNVEDYATFAETSLGVQDVWFLYQRCGGRKQAVPKDTERCTHSPAAAPPPPPQSPPPPRQPPTPPQPDTLPAWELTCIVLGSVLTAGMIIGAVITLVVWYKGSAAVEAVGADQVLVQVGGGHAGAGEVLNIQGPRALVAVAPGSTPDHSDDSEQSDISGDGGRLPEDSERAQPKVSLPFPRPQLPPDTAGPRWITS